MAFSILAILIGYWLALKGIRGMWKYILKLEEENKKLRNEIKSDE